MYGDIIFRIKCISDGLCSSINCETLPYIVLNIREKQGIKLITQILEKKTFIASLYTNRDNKT